MGRHRNPGLTDAAWLRGRYVDDGASLAEIAADVGCSRAAVQRALAAAGIFREALEPSPLADLASLATVTPMISGASATLPRLDTAPPLR